ncbi:hypothetical protein ACLOJK_023149 [Asimina triloba]
MKVEKASGEFPPLLAAAATEEGRCASVSGAVFNLATSIIGAGIMSIPATLKVLGVVPAVLLIFAVAYMCEVSTDFLLRYTDSGSSTTYAGVMCESFGKMGSLALQISVTITNMGCLIIYLIIIGKINYLRHHYRSRSPGGDDPFGRFAGMVWHTLVEHAPSRASHRRALCHASPPPLKACSIGTRKEGPFASRIIVGDLGFCKIDPQTVVFVVVSSAMALYAFFQGKSESPRWLPDLSGNVSFFDLFTAVPVIVTAFTFHFNVHPIRYELDKLSDMETAVRISLIICAAIYTAIGFFGYLLFGDSTMADILTNFDRSSNSSVGALLNDIVRLSYALHLMLVYPLINYSLRINIDGLIFTKSPSLSSDGTRFLLLTFFLSGFVYLAAIAFPNIWSLFQFVGSTSAVCIAFIFPGAIALRSKLCIIFVL